ncbi:MAG TPA: glycosyl hydrolase family 28-related protein, partial [Acidimicrobiia bacterium]
AGGTLGAAALAPGTAGAAGATPGGIGPTVVVSTFTGAAIQAALNGLPAAGGAVQLVAGSYAVSTTIQLRSGCQLFGAGRGATVLRLVNSADTTVVRNADVDNGNPGVAIRALTIDGNRAHQGHTGAAHGVELHRCANWMLDDLEVGGCDGMGILVTGDGTITRVGQISNVFAHDNGVHGIWVTFAMREVRYTGVTCDINAQDGLVVDHSEAVVTGAHCSRNGRDGIRITNVIANNLVGILADLNGRNGIHVLGFVNSVGAAWAAHNNGQQQAASDVYFDGTLNTYGPTDHSVVNGIECGAAQKSAWGSPYPPNPSPSETYGLAVDSAVQNNLTLVGVQNSGGMLGSYSLAPSGSTGSLVIVDQEMGTNRLRLLRGSLHIAGGDLVHDAAGRLGFYGAGAKGQPTVSGDTTHDPTAVLRSLVAALAALGLVNDATK